MSRPYNLRHSNDNDEALTELPELPDSRFPSPTPMPMPTPPHAPIEAMVPPVGAPVNHATFQQEIMGMMRLLTRTVTQERQPSATPFSSPPKEPKVKDPEVFKGDRRLLSAFLTEIELVFTLQSSRFTSDITKINYVISYLRDSPLLAIRPYLGLPLLEQPDFMISYVALVEYLKTNYGDPDEKGTARRKLRSLEQTSSASAYFAELNQYIAILGWRDQEPVIDRAIFGLKSGLKDELARSGRTFDTLSELIGFVIPLDNRLYDRELEKKKENEKARTTVSVVKTSPATVTVSATPPTVANTSASLAVPTARTTNAPPPRASYARGPVGEGEKTRRRLENCCIYCGDKSHLISACPALARKNQVLTATLPPTGDSPAPKND